MYNWQHSSFKTAAPQGNLLVSGFVYKGLGLDGVWDEELGTDDWVVTHLASDTQLGTIVGLDLSEALKLATMFADIGDWHSPVAPTSPGQLAELAQGSFLLEAAN